MVDEVRRGPVKCRQIGAHPLIDLRGITLYPPENRHTIHRQSALAHHLFDVAVGELNTI